MDAVYHGSDSTTGNGVLSRPCSRSRREHQRLRDGKSASSTDTELGSELGTRLSFGGTGEHEGDPPNWVGHGGDPSAQESQLRQLRLLKKRVDVPVRKNDARRHEGDGHGGRDCSTASIVLGLTRPSSHSRNVTQIARAPRQK